MRNSSLLLVLVLGVLSASAQLEREWSTFYASPEGVVPVAPVKAVADPGGGYYVVAKAEYREFANFAYVLISRYDARGIWSWQRAHVEWGILDSLTAVDAACTADGVLIVACNAGPLTANQFDTALLAVGRSGDLLWYRREQTTSDERALRVAIAPNGNIYLGRRVSPISNALLCYSPTGDLLWRSPARTMSIVSDIAFAPNGTAYLTGGYYYGYNVLLAAAAIDASGNLLWRYQSPSEWAGTTAILYDTERSTVHIVRSRFTGEAHYFRLDALSGALLTRIPLDLRTQSSQDNPEPIVQRTGDGQLLVGCSNSIRLALISPEDTVQLIPMSYPYYLFAPIAGGEWVFGTGATANSEVRRVSALWTQQWLWTSPFDLARIVSLAIAPDAHIGALLRTTTYQLPNYTTVHRAAFAVLSPTGVQLSLNVINDLPGKHDFPNKGVAYRGALYFNTFDKVIKYGFALQPEWVIDEPTLRDFAVDLQDGAVYVATQVNSNQARVTKYTTDGSPLWTTTIPIVANSIRLMQLPTGDLLLFTSASGTSAGAIARLSPTGAVLNNFNLGNKRVELAALSPDNQHLYLVIDGPSSSPGFDLAIYDLSLQLIRQVTFSGYEHAYSFYSISSDLNVTDDSVYLAAPLSSSYYLLQMDRDGNLLARTLVSSAVSSSSRVTRDSEGRYYLIQDSRSIRCFDTTGRTLWNFEAPSDYLIFSVAAREGTNQVFVSADQRRTSGPEVGGIRQADARLLVLNRQTGQLISEVDESLPEALSSSSFRVALTPRRLWSLGVAMRLFTAQDVFIHRYRMARAGDVNGDGCVDDADLLSVLFAFGTQGTNLEADLNEDGLVDDTDLLEVLFEFGQGCR